MDERMQNPLGKQDFTMICSLDSITDIVLTKDNYLMLRVTPKTDYPEYIDFNSLPPRINVFVNNNRRLSYKDNQEQTDDERISKAYHALSDKWLVCTPNITYNEESGKYYVVAYDVSEIGRNEGVNPANVKFWRLPIFHPISMHNRPKNQYEFEDALLKGKIIGQVTPWPSDADEAPHGIIWRNSDEEDLTLYTGIESQSKQATGLSFAAKDHKNIQKIRLTIDDNEWFTNFLEFSTSTIGYIPVETYEKYEKLSKDFTPVPLPESSEIGGRTDEAVKSGQSVDSVKLNTEDVPHEESDSLTKPVGIGSQSDKQNKFIRHFQLQTQRSNLHFDLKDLINFHTAMESDGLVILSGLSGTGKSQLVNAYANALGIAPAGQSSEQLCFVPVRPYWADDSDLLGYADMVNNVYRPGDSGLVDTLVNANKNSNRLYIVVFDEMNLARVEHYFSQFLSVLEMSSNNRYVQLYNSKLASRLYNSEAYPSRVKIQSNILFVGTVNTDESTFQFSDKVLDRSNVISLHIMPFNESYPVPTQIDLDKQNEAGESEMNAFNYLNMLDKENSETLTQQEKTLLWELHLALNHQDRNLGIGWRIVRQIDSFLKYLPTYPGGVSRSEALDLQIVQRVLTKVRGSEEQLANLLGDTQSEDSLSAIFDKYADMYEFPQARRLLEQKARELKLYGFTM